MEYVFQKSITPTRHSCQYGGRSMLAKTNSLKQNSKSTSTLTLRLFILVLILSGYVFSCNANIEQKQQAYQDIIGYWKEYIIHDDSKEETALRKIVLNSNGKLEQSIVYELGTQCRIWLNNDDISYNNGTLEFWRGEFKGEMSEDKNSIRLIYKQMSNPFLLERIQDEQTIQLLDSLEKCIGAEYAYSITTLILHFFARYCKTRWHLVLQRNAPEFKNTI